MKRITIIGGGASGTLLAANLLKNATDSPIEINMVEKRSVLGRGVAYSTADDVHLLNVPASRMGAYADETGNFLVWLNQRGYSYGPDSFVPRRLFGEYLLDMLDHASATKSNTVTFNVFEDDVVDIEVLDKKARMTLHSGEFIYSEKVVLAFGNFLPPHPSVKDRSFTSHPKYFRSPWQSNVFTSIGPNDRFDHRHGPIDGRCRTQAKCSRTHWQGPGNLNTRTAARDPQTRTDIPFLRQ